MSTLGVSVDVYGPNLLDQSKGNIHVHRMGCKDGANYGPGKKLGGECGYVLHVTSRRRVVEEIFAGQLDEGCSYDLCAKDVYFAPCLKGVLR